MYQGHLTTDLIETTQRLNAYHGQVSLWLAGIPTNDPAAALVRAQVVVLKDRLNKARIGLGMVRRLPTPTAIDLGQRDIEKMAQDLDRTVERMNTYSHQLEAGRNILAPSDPLYPVVVDIAGRIRTALNGVRSAREASVALAGSAYRGSDLLTLI
ncbi:MAG: hypothetical protein WCI67_21955 [Chloroflexales bacterium]